ncbi:thioesterase-like superfamily domain-containing protein [Trichoderma barbatum]
MAKTNDHLLSSDRSSPLMSTWATATQVTSMGTDRSHIYQVNLQPDWAVGTAPSGGYVTALLTRAACKYHSTINRSLHQTDIIGAHIEFFRRSRIGPAFIHIKLLKLGDQVSILRAELKTPKGASNQNTDITVEATITLGNLRLERDAGGPSHLVTRMNPVAIKRNMVPLEDCVEWVEADMADFAPAFAKISCWYPKGSNNQPLFTHPTLGPSVRDTWIKWAPQTGAAAFDSASLSLLVDISRPMAAQWKGETGYLFLTLQMAFETRKIPPESGWKWLYLRTEMTVCQNRRYGMDVTIFDESGDVVVMSRHVILLVPVTKVKPQKDKENEAKL